jgi:H+-translocating NAD(P) transhydrogenase subunit alpha
MPQDLIFGLYIFVLAGFLGHHVISKVPHLLHTPLMAGTNAISGISLVGSLVAAGGDFNQVSTILGCIAVTCATINTVGGFMITDRMLKMFRKKGPGAAATGGGH